VRTHRSAWALAFGPWIGVRITFMASVRKTASKGVAELRVSIVDEKPERLVGAELHGEVARLLADPPPIGIRGAGDVLDPSRRKRDEEQHVDPLQEGGLDGEEVAGKHACRLRSQKRTP
jgi:hypothetical protein